MLSSAETVVGIAIGIEIMHTQSIAHKILFNLFIVISSFKISVGITNRVFRYLPF